MGCNPQIYNFSQAPGEGPRLGRNYSGVGESQDWE
jgi:hypothetical protein